MNGDSYRPKQSSGRGRQGGARPSHHRRSRNQRYRPTLTHSADAALEPGPRSRVWLQGVPLRVSGLLLHRRNALEFERR